MTADNLIGLIILIVIFYLAFRVGAVLMKVALGLVAILVIVWLVSSLLSGQPITGV